jgi:putative oxidoreductase
MRFDRALPFDHPALSLLGRLLMAYIFVTSGMGKVFSWAGNVAYMNTRHLPLVPVLLAIAMVVEVGGAICLISGLYTRTAAFVMFVYMIFVTVIFHAYWSAPPNLAPMQETHFRKNLAIMGGLLFVAAHGPGRWTAKPSVGRKEL